MDEKDFMVAGFSSPRSSFYTSGKYGFYEN